MSARFLSGGQVAGHVQKAPDIFNIVIDFIMCERLVELLVYGSAGDEILNLHLRRAVVRLVYQSALLSSKNPRRVASPPISKKLLSMVIVSVFPKRLGHVKRLTFPGYASFPAFHSLLLIYGQDKPLWTFYHKRTLF